MKKRGLTIFHQTDFQQKYNFSSLVFPSFVVCDIRSDNCDNFMSAVTFAKRVYTRLLLLSTTEAFVFSLIREEKGSHLHKKFLKSKTIYLVSGFTLLQSQKSI